MIQIIYQYRLVGNIFNDLHESIDVAYSRSVLRELTQIFRDTMMFKTFVPTAVILPALGFSADPPRVDLLGQAAFTDTYITLGINSTASEARDTKNDFSVVHVGLGAYSVSGYSSRPEKDAGGLLGAGIQLRTWFGSDRGVDWFATAPFILIVGGGYVDPVKNVRLSLLGEVGPGIAFDRISDHGNSTNKGFRPALHAGIQASAMMRFRPSLEAGLIFGYDYDHMPNATSSGPLFGLGLRFIAQ